MPIFNYKAQDEDGKVISDVVQAANKADAVSSIKARGLQILTIKNPENKINSLFTGHISVSEKAIFCRFMATMLRSGLSLPESVDIIKQETKNKKLSKVLTDISYQTQKGKTLGSVVASYPDEFDTIFLTMVKVGEESGTLDKSFDYLAIQLSGSHELSQKVKGSLMYPAVIIVAMIANMLMMAIFVLPRISSVFLKLDLPLPAYTRVLLKSGEFFGNNSLLVIMATVMLLIAAALFVTIRTTRAIVIRALSTFPAVRNVVTFIDVARFARTFSTLLKSGVPIVSALDVAADSLSQPKMRKVAENFGEDISKGESLSDILIRSRGVFPGIMVQTVRAGEKSGTLEKVLEELAMFYEQEVEFSLKRMTALIEPVLMLLIGMVVGVMVIIMIAPIYSLIGGLQESIQGP
jgi:type IV pilus assembly protein PilC